MISLTYQICASVLQPLVGTYTDSTPQRLAVRGDGLYARGSPRLGFAQSYAAILVAAALVGAGSAVFHPESSRIARLASGGRHGLAQSIFQVGAAQAVPRAPCSRRGSSSSRPLERVLVRAGRDSRDRDPVERERLVRQASPRAHRDGGSPDRRPESRVLDRVAWSLAILVVLVFSKYFYLAGISSFYSFFLIEKFHVSIQAAQVYLFLFLLASALGTLIGGPLGDRIGRKRVIWFSILGWPPSRSRFPCRIDIDCAAEFDHRLHPVLRLLRDSRVRSGAHAGQGRAVSGCSSAWRSAWAASAPPCSGCSPTVRHRLRVSAVRIPAAARDLRRVPAEHRAPRRPEPRLSHEFVSLIAQYGLLVVALNVLVDQIGLPVPAMPTLIVAGAMAAAGRLSIGPLFAWSVVACVVPDCGWYLIGKRMGSGF